MSRKSFTGANAVPLGPRNPAIGAKRTFSAEPPPSSYDPNPFPFKQEENKVSSNAAAALRAAQAAAAALAKLQKKPTEQTPTIKQEENTDEGRGRPRKKRSRWGTPDQQTNIPGIPAIIPPNLTKDQQKTYIVQLQIEDLTRKLKSGDLGISPNPEDRSPSPEPIYNNEGKRLNTREYRTRKKLEEDRHKLIQDMMKLNENYKAPIDYKPPVQRISEQIMIPADLNPSINFVGLLIGPRGNTLKKIEKESQCKIMIRGKGSVKEGKIGRKDGMPLPGEDEPLHALVTGMTIENVQKAVKEIHDIIKQGIEQPEGQNDLRKLQLMELARLNGTLRDDALPREREWLKPENQNITNTTVCTKCGGRGHIAQDCMSQAPSVGLQQQAKAADGEPVNEVDKAKMDSEYLSLMAELGEGPAPSGGNNAGNKDNSNQQFGGDQFGGPRAPWMGPRGPGFGGPMGFNGPPGNFNAPNMMGGPNARAPPWMRGGDNRGRGGNFGPRGGGRGSGHQGYGVGYQGYPQGNMPWMGQYDASMGYGTMDGSNMGMGGHMGNMMNPPPPPPNAAPQQPPLPPGSSNAQSSNWQQQSWGNSSDGDGQEPPGESKSTESSINNEYSDGTGMQNNQMGGYGNMMGYGMWGGMGNMNSGGMGQPPMPSGPGPVPPPPPSNGNDSGQSGNANQQWGGNMDYNNMMGMGMMGFGMPPAPPPPPPST